MPLREDGGEEVNLLRACGGDGTVHDPRGLLEVCAPAACGSQRADSQRRQGCSVVALAHRVRDAQPEAVRVGGVVEEVTCDVVAGEHPAGELVAVEHGETRREKVLLDLRGWLYILAAPCRVHDVRVAARELSAIAAWSARGRRSRSGSRSQTSAPIARSRTIIAATALDGSLDAQICSKSGSRSSAISGPTPTGALIRSGNAASPAASLMRQDPSMSITYTPTRQPAAVSAAAAIPPGSAAGDTCNRPAGSVWLIFPVCPDTVRPAHTWRPARPRTARSARYGLAARLGMPDQ